MSGRRKRGGKSSSSHEGTNIFNSLPDSYKQVLTPSVLPSLFGRNSNARLTDGSSPYRQIHSVTLLRPELLALKMMSQIPDSSRDESMDESIQGIAESTAKSYGLNKEMTVKTLYCNLAKSDGSKRMEEGKYEEAVECYLKAMRQLLGENAELPSKGGLNERYLKVTEGEHGWRPALDLVDCCNCISMCYWKRDQMHETLEWIQELQIIYTCQRLSARPKDPPWINWHLNTAEYYTIRMQAAIRASQIFKSLGNTASAWYFGIKALAYPADCDLEHPLLRVLAKEVDPNMERWRHPDPRLVDKWDITKPEFQMRGVWRRLALTGEGEGGAKPKQRHAFSGWVWKGGLYVSGGQSDPYTFLDDTWRLDLTTNKWRSLPDFPEGLSAGYKPHNHRLTCVHDDAAWIFSGERNVWKFDLVTERWSKVRCKFSGASWPYQSRYVTEHCVAILDGILYVFGGDDNNTSLGTNIFLSLNLKTLEWKHLGGVSDCVPEIFYPNLRRFATLFAVPRQRKLYLMYGNACRAAAQLKGKPHGNAEDYNLEDMWSYEVDEKKWQRERIKGNPPCPRTEMASAYHPGLDKVVVYGGYNASVPSTTPETNNSYNFTFYGDTFLFDPNTGNWQHVLVRGFPSYRCQAQFFVDDQTGRIYLYGGYTNSDYVPSKHAITRAFGDVWNLLLDCEGGHLTADELERDTKLSQLGPWRRCATCSNVSTIWKKCGGTCGGKYFFCSTECQKDGWADHKANDGCRKK